MLKNILSVFIFLFCFSFFYLVVDTYFSSNQDLKKTINREKISQTINNSIIGLPILNNDTNDVIEFNSEYDNQNNRIKRNFWKLFETND
jgi:hypothetical protein